ncbi:MAG: STAS/SEC14 domain-containing protein [Rhizomicrobium sp.]
MLEVLKGFPESVLAVRAKGHVTARDYREVCIPAVEAALKAHDKIRLYYELGRDFEGISPAAVWDDTEIGLKTLTHWEKIAVVTDVEWIKHATSLFAIILPGSVKVFPVQAAADARVWISAD